MEQFKKIKVLSVNETIHRNSGDIVVIPSSVKDHPEYTKVARFIDGQDSADLLPGNMVSDINNDQYVVTRKFTRALCLCELDSNGRDVIIEVLKIFE